MERRAFVAGLRAALTATVLSRPMGWAQQAGKIPRVGFLSTGKSVSPDHPYLAAIRDGLRDVGYVVGQNIIVDWQFAENDPSRVPELVEQLIRSHVDVLLCATTTEVLAASRATRTIPIIMLGTGDPVGLGFAQSLSHPGGNITGLSPNHAEVGAKRLQLLREVGRKTSKVGVLNPNTNAGSILQFRALATSAQSLGIELYGVDVSSPNGLERAFETFRERQIESVVIIPDPLLWDHRTYLSDLAIKARLATIGQDRQFTEAGLLMSYGVNEVVFWRRAGTFIDRILRGAKPGDLPIEQPSKFDLIINLKTARALGLTIPPSLLLRADQVIE